MAAAHGRVLPMRERLSTARRSRALSFEDVFLKHYGFVRRCVRRFGTPDAHLDDVAQEVFLVAHAKQREFSLEQPQAFLRGIAWRVSANHRRRVQTRARFSAPLVSDAFAGTCRTDARLESDEKGEVVREALNRMDPPRPEIFDLVVVEELPVAEVAAMLKVSTHTIYRHVRAARESLSAAIEKHARGDE